MEFINAHHVSKKVNLRHKEEGTRGQKSLLEVMSREVLVESVRTVAGVQSWKQRVPDNF